MKPLRTLKDLDTRQDAVWISELKVEAIKWAKLYIKQYDYTVPDLTVTRAILAGKIEVLKEFHNITSEDLK